MIKRVITMALLSVAAAGTAFSEDSSIPIAFGAGMNYMGYTNYQVLKLSSLEYDVNSSFSSIGVDAFLDVTRYLTFNAGYRFPIGDYKTDVSVLGQSASITASNHVNQFEFGAEVKYPFDFNNVSLAPKLGIVDVIYLSGDLGGGSPTSDGKTILSPLLVTLGADLNFKLQDHWFLRFPVDIGFAVNSKLSDDYYKTVGVPYDSSIGVGFRLGADVGYQL